MKSIAAFVILVSCFSFNFLQAQDAYPKSSIGLRAGGNANSWTNEFPSQDVNGTPIFPEKWVIEYGYHGGVYANVRLSQLVAIEPILLYTLKGTGTSLQDQGFTVEGIVDASYIDLQFLVRLYVANGFNLFIGPQLSYLVSAKYDLLLDGVKLIDGQDRTDDLSELDVGGIFGLGYEFDGGFNVNLAAEGGFLTVDGLDVLSTFNRTIRLSVGYTFK